MTANAMTNEEAGRIAANIMRSRTWADHAGTMQYAVADALREYGFDVVTEYPARKTSECRGGRIDIVALLGGGAVAIELDCRVPRHKSIAKLRTLDCHRLIGLRGVCTLRPDGIHEVVPLRVGPLSGHAEPRR